MYNDFVSFFKPLGHASSTKTTYNSIIFCGPTYFTLGKCKSKNRGKKLFILKIILRNGFLISRFGRGVHIFFRFICTFHKKIKKSWPLWIHKSKSRFVELLIHKLEGSNSAENHVFWNSSFVFYVRYNFWRSKRFS